MGCFSISFKILQFEQRVNPVVDLEKLLNEPKSFWVSLLNKYLVDNKYVAVQCIPSTDEYEKMIKEEEKRITKQVESIGEKGLEEKKQILEKAVEFNSRDPPKDMLTSVPIPSVKSINFINIDRYTTDLDKRNQIDLSSTSVFTCFDHIKSEFVYVGLINITYR